jgi:hypothetical protein
MFGASSFDLFGFQLSLKRSTAHWLDPLTLWIYSQYGSIDHHRERIFLAVYRPILRTTCSSRGSVRTGLPNVDGTPRLSLGLDVGTIFWIGKLQAHPRLR